MKFNHFAIKAVAAMAFSSPVTMGSISYPCDGSCTGLNDGQYPLPQCNQYYTCSSGVNTGASTCSSEEYFAKAQGGCSAAQDAFEKCGCCYTSCQEAYDFVKAAGSTPASGSYRICPTGDSAQGYEVYCDQETAGGGWMLFFSYNHTAGENQDLDPTELPIDPGHGYSHRNLQDLESYGYTMDNAQELRFYCHSSGHHRKIHFTTTNAGVIEIAYAGNQANNDVAHWTADTTYLADHSASIPAATNHVQTDTNGGLHESPFVATPSSAWALRRLGTHYGCDDNSDLTSTLHNVWVRLSPPTCYHSCQDAYDSVLAAGKTPASGIFYICPTGNILFHHVVYCDQETSNGSSTGGWMLLYSYKKESGTSNSAFVPSLLPTDPDNGSSYAHIQDLAIYGYKQGNIKELRFYCEASAHTKKIHFATDSANLLAIAYSGSQLTNDPSFWSNEFTPLEGHNGVLPAATTVAHSTSTGGGFFSIPFAHVQIVGFSVLMYGWSIAPHAGKCDDGGSSGSTLHNVWVRLSPSCYTSCKDAYDSVVAAGNTPASGIVYICPSGDPDNAIKAFCDQTTDGGGWMLFSAYKHLIGNNDDLVPNKLPTDPANGYSHIDLQYLESVGFTQENVRKLRFYCESSLHNRTIHFTTRNAGVIRIAYTGNQEENQVSYWDANSGFNALGDHSATLPGSADNVFTSPSGGLNSGPFSRTGAYWSADPVAYWSCDDEATFDQATTLHNVWVKIGFPTEAPSAGPSSSPSLVPSDSPSIVPSDSPSQLPSLSPGCHLSCVAAMDHSPRSGLYRICPTGDESKSLIAYCDMETDGGGWLLFFAYSHTEGENLALNSTTLPTDPQQGYSHINLEELGYSRAHVKALRFYCSSSEHDEIIHFTTDHPGIIEIAFTGNQTNNDPSFWNNGTTLLSNGTFLPGSTNGVANADPNGGFSGALFYQLGGTSRAWAVRANGRQFACDGGASAFYQASTLHNVWAKLDFDSEAPSVEPSSFPSLTPSHAPSSCPSLLPSDRPSDQPSDRPSNVPSQNPSLLPSESPSDVPPPTAMPSLQPSDLQAPAPSGSPSLQPSALQAPAPSGSSSFSPSGSPSMTPSAAQGGANSATPSVSPADSCPNPLVPVIRTYYFIFSGSAADIEDDEVIDAFRDAYSRLSKDPCSPVLISLVVASRVSRSSPLVDGSISPSVQLIEVNATEGNNPLHRRLRDNEVNVEVISTQVADTPLFDTADETLFIDSFNAAVQASSGSHASVASLSNSAVPSAAPSLEPSVTPSSMPSASSPTIGSCCITKAWGDFEGRLRCPVDNWSCLCPGSECCEVCRSTMMVGGRMLQNELEDALQSDYAKPGVTGWNEDDTGGKFCFGNDKCSTKNGSPGFYLHQDQFVKRFLKGGDKACVSSCVPVEIVIELMGSGWTCGSCGEDDRPAV